MPRKLFRISQLVALTLMVAPVFCQPAGVITTVAGNGTAGFSGDGGPATKAEIAGGFAAVMAVSTDNQGNLYIADNGNNRVRKVDAKGIITTVAGGGNAQPTGIPATSALIAPGSVVVDSAGNLILANGNQIFRVDTSGTITTIAGGPTNPEAATGDGGPALQAGFLATDAGVDSAGNIYLSDGINFRIRKIDTAGIISTFAGNGTPGYSGDRGLATKAQLSLPQGLSVDKAGNVYFADGANARIRKVDTKGIITTVAGNGNPIYLAILQEGGPALAAGMTPLWVTVDAAGNLYIVDKPVGEILKVDTKGIITTVAGMFSPIPGSSGDGGPATKASLYQPTCVAVDGAGNLYIADTGNSRIRKVSSGVTAPAGAPTFSATGVVNGASFSPGGIVPGEIATIFGSNLTSSTGINLATSLPLPTELQHVSVTINGIRAPIFAVDNVNGQQQINFQVPWEAQGVPKVQVTNNGAASSTVLVPVIPAQPAVFSYSAGGEVFGAILHSNFHLADTAHPAQAGETVLIYCTGLSYVKPLPKDGVAATGEPTIATPVVTIGGANAPVSFSGLAPGYVGLYQINAEIPAGLAAKNQPVTISVLGSASKSVLLPIQ